MQDRLAEVLVNYEEYAIIISLLLNICISVFGVIPTLFITAANLIVFGFWKGTMISFLGEALGAILSFWLYRKGFKNNLGKKVSTYPLAKKLLNTNGKDAFLLIIALRLFPFVPSGLVTFASAIGEVSFIIFIFSSSLGKLPALLLEAYSVYHVTKWTAEGKLILTIISVVVIAYLIRKIGLNTKSSK
ncbi:TVP38/TMEM64 family protein [Bacillus sinesaloumensis]|uniref:TVP38/TMEM64 family protein n=1 Tax=Litchfieldia sinesaloumensis TaxID=1926280 RepID=UPI0009888529|nr:VTT domain-containing protein [Bacillus sinesaloumensis]